MVTAAVLAELEVRVQEKLGLQHRVRLQQLHQASGQLLDIKSMEHLPARCTINICESLKAHDKSVKEMIMALKEEQLAALENEQYEECGRLRDEIRRLESTILGGNIKKARGDDVADKKTETLEKAIREFEKLSSPVSSPRHRDRITATHTISPASPKASMADARPDERLTPLERRQRARVADAIRQTQRNLRSQSYDHQGQSLEKLFCLYDSRRLGLLKYEEFRSAVRKGGRVTQQQLNDGELRQLFRCTCGSEDPQSITRADLEYFVWGSKAAVVKYADRVVLGVDGVGQPRRAKKKKGPDLKSIQATSSERHRNRLGSPERTLSRQSSNSGPTSPRAGRVRRGAPPPALTVGDVAGQHNRHTHLRDNFYGSAVDRTGHRSCRIRALVSPTRTRPSSRSASHQPVSSSPWQTSPPPPERSGRDSVRRSAREDSRRYRALVRCAILFHWPRSLGPHCL